MLSDAIRCLACPVCAEPMDADGAVLRCRSGHSFDVAREGYANLLPGGARPGTADTAAMVSARAAFLASGHFAPIADALSSAVAAALSPRAAGCVLDVGAGPGYYAAAVLEALPGRAGLALDISKHAARRAARAHERLAAVVCDAWSRLPVQTGAAAVVLDVFAPRNADEFHRVLAPGGVLVVVTPTPRHLEELASALPMVRVDPDKADRLGRTLGERFVEVASEPVDRVLELSRDDAVRLVAMGPSAHHADLADVGERAARIPAPIAATLSVSVSVFRRR